jgi:hypothetical protein
MGTGGFTWMLDPKLPPRATFTTLIFPTGIPNMSWIRSLVLWIVWVVLQIVTPPSGSGLTTAVLVSSWLWYLLFVL